MNHKILSHLFLKCRLDQESKAVDMTCGNGNDTKFLASICRKVLAIDIQEKAIKNTQDLCGAFTNISYLTIDHSKIDFKEHYDAFMYNLGYLPHSDKSIITTASSTVRSLEKVITTKPKYISIACYRGHKGGSLEYEAIVNYLRSKNIQYIKLCYASEASPVTLLIDFENPSSSTILVDELRHLPQTQVNSILKSKHLLV